MKSKTKAPGTRHWLIGGLVALAGLWLVARMATLGEPVWALGTLSLLGLGLYIYVSASTTASRYLFPGLAAMAVFVLFPMLLTLRLSTTNFSAANLLNFERAKAYLLEQTLRDEGRSYAFTLHGQGNAVRLALAQDPEGIGNLPPTLATPAFEPGRQAALAVSPLSSADALGPAQPIKDVVALREVLAALTLGLPDGTQLSYSGLREFAVLKPVWKASAGDSITNSDTNQVFTPNTTTGFFEDDRGNRQAPGFSVGVGLSNYAKVLGSEAIRGPFLSIFLWTVMFSGISVLLASALGMTLAVMLNWPDLKGRTAYRTLLFLPYAVPGFISILVFKGLFNQNFGEINMILNALFGIKPSWFADPTLAKCMLVVVNVWLGYAYFMILCSGMLQTISADLYEASAIAGAGPLTNFFKITLPQIIPPLVPLLISAFAFNFNNFVLVALLTDGRPDFLNTTIPAGTTDILVSYTYRIAFKDAGADFGLAAAISVMIFAMVAVMAFAQIKLSKKDR